MLQYKQSMSCIRQCLHAEHIAPLVGVKQMKMDNKKKKKSFVDNIII